jgi:type II secretory pathway pseudopilin PulG
LSLARSEELQKQSEQVVTFTLVELLTSLVFIAMLLALVLRSETLQNLDPSREHVQRLTQALERAQRELKDAQREIVVLNDELEAQRSLVRRLMAQAGQPLPPNDVVVVPTEEWNKYRNAGQVSREQQEQIQQLLKQIAALKGGGSVTRPYCTTNSGYLLTVQLNGDGTITPIRNWPEVADSDVSKVTGISALSGGGRMSTGAFGAAAARVDGWARSQEIPCAFRVRVTSSHGNLPLYLRQLATVEQHFYVTRAR